MNFPDEPFFRFLHWLIDAPTIGGIIVLGISGAIFVIFLLTLYWIVLGAHAKQDEVYTYPTSTLLEHTDYE